LGVSRRIGKKNRERRIGFTLGSRWNWRPHKPDRLPKRKSASEFRTFLRQADAAFGSGHVMVQCTTSLMTN
jgi:hypothetical protein